VRRESCVFGAIPTGGANAAGGKFNSIGRAPRQLARLLKAIQGSGDAAFRNVNKVTKVMRFLLAFVKGLTHCLGYFQGSVRLL
jgi:hypothetical protein